MTKCTRTKSPFKPKNGGDGKTAQEFHTQEKEDHSIIRVEFHTDGKKKKNSKKKPVPSIYAEDHPVVQAELEHMGENHWRKKGL